MIASSPQAKADLLSKSFGRNFNTSVAPLTIGDIVTVSPDECPSGILCTEDDIVRLLSDLDTTKATGPDGISALMLKSTALAIAPLVTLLCNLSISHGTVPGNWKTSLIIPIHKQGDASNPGNYRPISLLPIISKVLERHISEKLRSFVTISDQQWGFLPGRSTTGAILSAVHDWHVNLNSGAEVQAVFFDLQKAFDTVPHAKLISKLSNLDIPTHLVSWISSYLCSRKQQVGVSGANSTPVDVISGVPQGSVLGPTLFLIYIDGLAEIPLTGGSLSMFADDILLYKVVRSLSDFQDLQSDVNSLVQWTSDHDLKLNAKKCKSLLLSRKRVPTCAQTVVVNGLPLEKVQSYKYLGVLISSNLSWGNHVSNICSRAKKHLGMLYRRFYRDADSSTLRMLYTNSVRPLLEYAVPVWDPHLLKDIKAIESVQRFATKVCTKAWLGVDYNDRLSMLNLTTLETRRTVLKHCFLYKVLNGLTFLPNPPIIPRPNTSHDTRSHTLTLQVPFAHSVSFYNSFCCQAPRLWNELPSEIVRSSSIASFKRACCIYLHLH